MNSTLEFVRSIFFLDDDILFRVGFGLNFGLQKLAQLSKEGFQSFRRGHAGVVTKSWVSMPCTICIFWNALYISAPEHRSQMQIAPLERA